MKRIEQEWLSFAKTVFSADLEATHTMQYKDLRRTFYGGARMMLTMLLGALSTGDEVTEADMQMLMDAEAEFAQFAKDVKEGRA